jgi:hypothetical protein
LKTNLPGSSSLIEKQELKLKTSILDGDSEIFSVFAYASVFVQRVTSPE